MVKKKERIVGRPQCGIVGGRLPEDQEPVQVGISLEEVHTGSYSPEACIFAPHAVPWPRWIPAWAHSLPLVYSTLWHSWWAARAQPRLLIGKAEPTNLSGPHLGFLGQAPMKNSAGVGVSQQYCFGWEHATLPAC